jgi:hypothetical protein
MPNKAFKLSYLCVMVSSLVGSMRGSSMSSRRPTPEQEAAVAAFRSGDDLVLQAGVGTGKTTTLTMLAWATRWQGRYLVFNKAMFRREAG